MYWNSLISILSNARRYGMVWACYLCVFVGLTKALKGCRVVFLGTV